MNEKEEQARWQQIWEELGLAAEPARESAPAEPAGARAEPVPSKAELPPTRQEAEGEDTHPPERITPAPVAEEPPATRGRRRTQVAIVEMHVEVPPAEPRPAAVEEVVETTPFAPASEEELPAEKEGEELGGRRRRNRRSRRGRSAEKTGEEKGAARTAAGAEEPAAEEATAGPLATPTEETEGEPEPAEEPERRRRRGRGRKKPGPEREPAVAESDPEADAAVEDDSDEEEEPGESGSALDDDELDDLANWNVPSWSELIASLYRPER